jgi:hypothetical protein
MLSTIRNDLTREADLADILSAALQDLKDSSGPQTFSVSLENFYTLFSKRVPSAIVHMTRHCEQPARR